MLRNVPECCRLPVCGFSACWFPTGHSSYICHEDGVRFSTLKISGWACDASRACRVRAATCGVEQWAVDVFTRTAAPHAACRQQKSGRGLETRLGTSEGSRPGWHCQNSYMYYMWSSTMSVVDISAPHSQTHYLYTCKDVVRPHLCIQYARHDVNTFSWLCVILHHQLNFLNYWHIIRTPVVVNSVCVCARGFRDNCLLLTFANVVSEILCSPNEIYSRDVPFHLPVLEWLLIVLMCMHSSLGWNGGKPCLLTMP